jgi:N-acylneuraminate cytidylyltransferase
MENISVFLPTREGSERVKNKNTRNFADIEGGLLSIKLDQLIDCKKIDEIILSTNDLKSIEIGNLYMKKDSRIQVIERPNELAQSATSLIDLVRYVPSVCNSEHILWTHVTSPFVKGTDYDLVIQDYFINLERGFDSLISVKKIKNFIWDTGVRDIINRVGNEKWPRTQDLKAFFEIDSAIFLSSRYNYFDFSDRIGGNPFVFELEGYKSFDVDWEEDFMIAELIYKFLFSKYD